MRNKKAILIPGGLVLGIFLLLLLVQLVTAASQPPAPPHEFAGDVTVGGQPAADGLEVSVKAFDVVLGQLVPISLTQDSLDQTGRHLTRNGAYGHGPKGSFFKVLADNPETLGVREGAKPGELLFFFIVTDAERGLEAQALLVGEDGELSLSIPFGPGFTVLDLNIFGPPTGLAIAPPSPTDERFPTFTWTPPNGDVVSFEVRILPDQQEFKDVGNVTSFTPTTTDFPEGVPEGPHTFQVRAVGGVGRKDAIGSLDFLIRTVHIVQGSVRLEGRSDHAGARVTFSGTDPVVTSTDGSFQVELLSGTYDVTVEREGFLTAIKSGLIVDTDTALPVVKLLGGDVNGDGDIDIIDLVIPAKNLGKMESPWP